MTKELISNEQGKMIHNVNFTKVTKDTKELDVAMIEAQERGESEKKKEILR